MPPPIPSSSTSSLTMPDGRRIAWLDGGDPQGRVVLWSHGAPSCRLEAHLFLAWALHHRVRILCPDRPGLGRSSPLLSPLPIRHYADDVCRILDHLQIERCSAFGGSAGGPYTLALAHQLPDRIPHAALFASGGIDPADRAASGWVDRAAGWLSHHAPALLGAYFRLIQAAAALPSAFIHVAAHLSPQVDLRPFRDRATIEIFRQIAAEAFRQGSAGAVQDYRRLAAPWGFATEDISCPVLVVQGDRDEFVPLRQARSYAARLPRGQLLSLPGAGHHGAIVAWSEATHILWREP